MTQEEFDHQPAWEDADFEGGRANHVTKWNESDPDRKTPLAGGSVDLFSAISHQSATCHRRGAAPIGEHVSAGRLATRFSNRRTQS